MTKESLQHILSGNSKISKFLNSVGFIWVIALVTLVFWFTRQAFPGIAVICVIMGCVLVLCEDATPVMTCFIFLFMIFSDKNMTVETTNFLWSIFLLFPIVGALYNIFHYKVKKFRLRGFSLSVLVVLLPWLLQGIGTPDRDKTRAFLCIAIAVAFVFVYFLIYITSRRSGKELLQYLTHVFLAGGVLIVIQILLHHFNNLDIYFKDSVVNLGWGSRNPVATILALFLPIPFYFATKNRPISFLFILLGCVEYVMILLLQSRGVSALATLALPALFLYSIICSGKKAKIGNIVLTVLIVVGAGLIGYYQRDLLIELFRRLVNEKLESVAREILWTEGINLFAQHPIFGVGFDYISEVYYKIVSHSAGPTYYHSTFIQIITSLGIFGGVCYAYLYYWRYRVAFTSFDKIKFVLLIGMIILEGYSFIDTIYFQPVGYFYMLIISLCMEKSLDYAQTTPLVVKQFDKLLSKRRLFS